MMYDSIGRYIGRSPGYYMLIVPGHAMAAVNGGKVFGFLDPNGGQATFKDEDEFSIFLSRYLLDAHISNLYEIALDKNPVRVYRLA
jgi:hypothetical protein